MLEPKYSTKGIILKVMEVEKVKKTLLFLLLIGVALFFATVSYAVISEDKLLPEIKDWTNETLRITKFDTVSGNRGIWLERDYKSADGKTYHAVRIDGDGVKSWNINENIISADDGPIGNRATYKTVKIYAKSHTAESNSKTDTTLYHGAVSQHPLTGLSLVVKLNKTSAITLESKNANVEEIIKAMRTLIESL